MRLGLPVVATDVPGIREAVGEVGAPFLAPPGDDTALAAAIVAFARDPALRARVGAANAALMKDRQSAEVTWRAYARLVAAMLDEKSKDQRPAALETVPR
jgi:glycosyltransferase involved in cell wall biosynthesis